MCLIRQKTVTDRHRAGCKRHVIGLRNDLARVTRSIPLASSTTRLSGSLSPGKYTEVKVGLEAVFKRTLKSESRRDA
jgi:hypothetical protein